MRKIAQNIRDTYRIAFVARCKLELESRCHFVKDYLTDTSTCYKKSMRLLIVNELKYFLLVYSRYKDFSAKELLQHSAYNFDIFRK